MSDSKKLRNSAANNVWDTTLLNKHHPRKGFNSSSRNFPAPMQMLQHILAANIKEMVGIVVRPLATIPSELIRWTKDDTHYDGSQHDEYLLHTDYLAAQLEVLDEDNMKVALATMLNAAVDFLNERFDLDGEQLKQLQDTAYLYSMLVVMAGLATIKEIKGELEPMWSLTPTIK